MKQEEEKEEVNLLFLPETYYQAMDEIYESDSGTTFKLPTDYAECPITEYISGMDLTLRERVFPNSKNIPKILLYMEKVEKYGYELLGEKMLNFLIKKGKSKFTHHTR
jgi:hypothetical protein